MLMRKNVNNYVSEYSPYKGVQGLIVKFMAVKKSRKFPGLGLFSDFKDSAFIAVKRDTML